MSKHWQEAQEEARATSGTNIVIAPDGKAALIGNETLGWRLVTSEQILQAQTEEGVDMVLEETDQPLLGWS